VGDFEDEAGGLKDLDVGKWAVDVGEYADS
jgi:hypothetical protein